MALIWFGRGFSATHNKDPRSALCVLQVNVSGSPSNRFNNTKRHSVDFFHAFVRQGLCRTQTERTVGGDEMNNVNSGKKLVADHRDQDARSTATDGIQLNELAQDDLLSISTTNNTYHVTVIDPETAQVLVRGGDFFRSDTEAQIAGASLNGSIKPFGIYIGYSIEFFVDGRCVRTSPVRVIRVLADSKKVA